MRRKEYVKTEWGLLSADLDVCNHCGKAAPHASAGWLHTDTIGPPLDSFGDLPSEADFCGSMCLMHYWTQKVFKEGGS